MKKYLLTGLLTAIPIWITWLAISFIFGLISDAGLPIVNWLVGFLDPDHSIIAGILMNSIFQGILALVIVVICLCILGWIATRVIGEQILEIVDRQIDKIPIIKTIYGGSKRLLDSFQKTQETPQKVVLINYPSPEMKTLGLITRTITDNDSGKKLAAVYVPTTPNPTSGFLEIVPVEDIVMTDWGVNEAISFIVSGGVIGPDNINYLKSVASENPDIKSEPGESE